MITSNIDSILAKLNNTINSETQHSEESFKSNLVSNEQETQSLKTDALTFENIKGITPEEIDTLFKNENDKNMAKNLRIATLFTNDEHLSKALFNTVLGQSFNVGYSYLTDRYKDKDIFFNATNSDNLFDLLQESISAKINNKTTNSTDVIPQEQLDRVLTHVHSFNFVSALSNSSKRGYDKYKDDENDYSFLYADYNLKYQELMYKYQEQLDKSKTMIEQFQ